MIRTPIFHSIGIKEGVWVRAFLNGLPLYKSAELGPNSRSGPVNDLLVPGENELSIELLHAPTPLYSPTLKGAVSLLIYEVTNPDTTPLGKRVIEQAVFPQMWEDVPERFRRFPYFYRARFDPGVAIHRPAYLDAPSVSFDCDGTPELREAVRRVHSAIEQNDVDRFLQEIALKLHHAEKALEGEEWASVAQKSKGFRDELFVHHLIARPLVMDDLHFEPRADGRVAYVTRKDGGFALEAIARGDPKRRLRTDLCFTQYAGDWRVFA